MNGRPDDETAAAHPGQASVPKPPSREEIEEISRAQEYLTDDWTGEGGTPPEDGGDA